MGKEENAGNHRFLLFQLCFLSFRKEIFPLGLHLLCCLQMLAFQTGLKFCHFVKCYSWDCLVEDLYKTEGQNTI